MCKASARWMVAALMLGGMALMATGCGSSGGGGGGGGSSSSSSTPASGFQIAAANADEPQAVAFDGANFVVAFHASGTSSVVKAALVSPAGAVLGTVVDTGRTGDPPTVACRSDATGDCIMVWADCTNGGGDCLNQIWGVRLTSDGSTLTAGTPAALITDTQDPVVGPGPSPTAQREIFRRGIVFDGNAYLMVWVREDQPSSGPATDYIRAQFIKADGSGLVGTVLPVNGTPATGGFNKGPSVWAADDMAEILVAWYDSFAVEWPLADHCGNTGSQQFDPTDVDGQFVTKATGSAASPTAGVLSGSNFPIQNDITRKAPGGPEISSNGIDFFVAWENEEVIGACSGTDLETGQVRVHGRAVTLAASGGAVADFGAGNGSLFPHLIYSGGKYFVTWTDFRNDANHDFACAASETTCTDLYGQTVTMSGTTPTLGTETALVKDASDQFGSPMASGAGKILMSWASGTIMGTTANELRGMFVTVP